MRTELIAVNLSACAVSQFFIKLTDSALSGESDFFRAQLPCLFFKQLYRCRAEIFPAESFSYRYPADNANAVLRRKYASRGSSRTVSEDHCVNTFEVIIVKFIFEALFVHKNFSADKTGFLGKIIIKFMCKRHTEEFPFMPIVFTAVHKNIRTKFAGNGSSVPHLRCKSVCITDGAVTILQQGYFYGLL